MRTAPALVALLLLPALAFAPPAASTHGGLGLEDPATPGSFATRLSWTGTVTGTSGAVCTFEGCTPLGAPNVACDGDDCDVAPLVVHVPPGHWASRHGGLRVVFWSGWDQDAVVHLRVRDAAGALVGEDARGHALPVVFVPSIPEGAYTIEVQGITGGAYKLDAFLESRTLSPTDVLPDLAPLTPTDLHVGACQPTEREEEGARRCLRFSNAIANVGEGPLEVRMGAADAVLVHATPASWTQRVSTTTLAGHRDVVVGPAVFHRAHGHYHYDGLARYVVHSYDLANATRGPPFAEAQKAGFCLIDWDLLDVADPARPHLGRFTYDGIDCLAPLEKGEIRMGISVGWYDLYESDLAEQYVDVFDAPDGVYELVSYANFHGDLLESDLANNEASVLFRLRGNAVTVLGPP